MTPLARYPPSRANDGSLRIEVPKFRNAFWKAACRLFRLNENIVVNFDDIGGFIYERCDGVRSVRGIIGEVSTEYGNRIEPAAAKVARFLRTMEANGIIRVNNPGAET